MVCESGKGMEIEKHTKTRVTLGNNNANFIVLKGSLYRALPDKWPRLSPQDFLAANPPETTPPLSGTHEGLVLRGAASIGKQVVYLAGKWLLKIQRVRVCSPEHMVQTAITSALQKT